MKLIKLAVLVVAGSILTGCISLFDEQQKDAVELKNREQGIRLPAELQSPVKSEEYSVTGQLEAFDETELTSPTMVLVILEGSWVDQDDAHPAKIMIEKPDLVSNLSEFVQQGISSFVEQHNYDLTPRDNGYKLTTVVQEETGFWFWKSLVDVEKVEYQISVNMKEHGRSGSISVDVLSYEKLDLELASQLPDNIRASSLAVQTLNNLMLEMDYQYRVKLKKERASLDISLALVKNIAGNYVITSQQDIRFVWSQVEDIIEELGFDVDESDESLYIFYTEFETSEESVWDLFGADLSRQLDIEPGEYEVTLSTSTTGVEIAFRSKTGDYLTQQQMQTVFEMFLQVVKEEEAEL